MSKVENSANSNVDSARLRLPGGDEIEMRLDMVVPPLAHGRTPGVPHDRGAGKVVKLPAAQ